MLIINNKRFMLTLLFNDVKFLSVIAESGSNFPEQVLHGIGCLVSPSLAIAGHFPKLNFTDELYSCFIQISLVFQCHKHKLECVVPCND